MKRKKSLQHIAIGIAMGTADIIPGVSGGTIAFISGIYDKLVTSIARIDLQLFQYCKQAKRKKAWTYIQGTFLIQLFGGIILAIVALAHTMSYALVTYPIYVYALFFGLILASIILISYNHLPRKIHLYTVVLGIAGILIGYILTQNGQRTAPETPTLGSIFIAGACASIAMILPGISGSYILLILGKYAYILDTLKTQIHHLREGITQGELAVLIQYETIVLVIFILGIIAGLVGFSKLLRRLLQRHHTRTLVVLIGFMIGTLPMIRPWSGTLDTKQWIVSLLLCCIGIAAIRALHTYATIKKTTS